MKRYYNKKKSKGLDLKEGNKVWLLYKNFKSRWPSKKLDYIRLRSKVCDSILGSFYNKTKDLNSDFNGILPINK